MDAEPEHVNPFASPLAEEGAVGPDAPSEIAALEAIRREHLSREASIKSVGLLYLIPAAIGALMSVVMVFGAVVAVTSGEVGLGEGAAMLGAMLLYAGLSVLFWWIGSGLRRLNPAVRIWTIVLSVIGLLGIPIGTLINGYILWLVAGRTGRYIFSDEYRGVIAATPHIRYKSSILMLFLVALVIVVGLLALAVVVSS